MNDVIESTARREKAASQKPDKRKGNNGNAAAPVESTALAVVTPTPMSLIQTAVQRGAGIDELGKLLDLQLRWEQNEARKAFVVALAAFKKKPPVLTKNKHVQFATTKGDTDYWHATLDHVALEIGKAMSEHGLSFTWQTAQDKGTITVSCVLTHEKGHSEKVTLEGSPDQSGGKNAIQAVGSTVTYLQRYTLLAACGLAVKDQDEDGNGSGPRDHATNTEQRRREDAAKASDRAADGAPPDYPQASFDANFPEWERMIVSGKSTAEKIIVKVSTKGLLSAGQLKKLRDVKGPQ